MFIDLKEQTFLKERLNNFDVFGFDLEDEIEAELDLNQNENLQLPNEYWKQEFSNLSEVIISAIGTDADKYGKLVRSILTNNTELILNALDEFVNLDNSKNFEITARFAAHFGILNQNVLNKFIPIYSSQLINLIKKEVNKSEDMMSDFVKNKLPEIFEILPFYLSKICDKDLQLEYFGELIACAGDDVELRDNVIENGLAYDIGVGVLEKILLARSL